jgi:hypothetical protein
MLDGIQQERHLLQALGRWHARVSIALEGQLPARLGGARALLAV